MLTCFFKLKARKDFYIRILVFFEFKKTSLDLPQRTQRFTQSSQRVIFENL